MKDQVKVNGQTVHIRDVINPVGMFLNGRRQRDYLARDMLPMSGKLIPEFDGRRNIRDMFAQKPSLSKSQETPLSPQRGEPHMEEPESAIRSPTRQTSQANLQEADVATDGSPRDSVRNSNNKKRLFPETSAQKPSKRSKSGAAVAALPTAAGKGQQSLKGFFMAKPSVQTNYTVPSPTNETDSRDTATSIAVLQPAIDLDIPRSKLLPQHEEAKSSTLATLPSTPASKTSCTTVEHSAQAFPPQGDGSSQDTDIVHDPIQSKESWSKLFTKPAPPRCEGHNEPCKTMLTKKNGMNRGRSFWMCARPLGPSGEKEKNTQWRCHTFIWCSDWNPTAAA